MRRFFHGRSLRFQLTVLFLVMVLIPLCIMFFASRWSIQNRLVRQTEETYATALTQAGSYISDKAVLAKNLVNMLFTDSHVQQEFNFFLGSDANEETAWLGDISSGRVTYKGSLLGSLSRIYLYQEGATLDFRSDRLYASLDEAGRSRLETWLKDSGNSFYFLTRAGERDGFRPRYIYLLAKVPSALRLGRNIGLMQAEIPADNFQQVLDSVPDSEHSTLYLMDGEGESFLSAGEARFAPEELTGFMEALAAGNASGKGMVRIRVGGVSYLAGMEEIAGTDWRILLAVPTADITGVTRGADQIMLLTLLILCALIVPLIALIAHNILRPMHRLQEGVEAVSRGDYSKAVPRSGQPELDRVTDSFNAMREKIQVMMAEQYRMGQDLKSKELQVLQEQINPHFLYNTIDLLHWEARKAGNREMEDLIHALSQFYKLSLGHGEEIVTLRHELDHVEAYLYVQNLRFMNRIQLKVDVPKELEQVRIVKMVLQPLAENSIQHGIREKPEETGTIEIRAEREGDHVAVTLSDDGVGMDEETISRIMSSEHPGYGVYNVNDRLVLHYGSGAGLQFRSVPGRGTSVTFRIPLE